MDLATIPNTSPSIETTEKVKKMETDEHAESALVTKQQIDLERPHPGRPAPPCPISGRITEPSRPMVQDYVVLRAARCKPNCQATTGATTRRAVPSRPMVQDFAVLRAEPPS